MIAIINVLITFIKGINITIYLFIYSYYLFLVFILQNNFEDGCNILLKANITIYLFFKTNLKIVAMFLYYF